MTHPKLTSPKICFCLLKYQSGTHRHYLHIYEFIEALSRKADVRLLVMQAEDPPEFKHPRSVIDLSGHGLRARFRRWGEIIRSRRLGYSVFYHHYTTAPARFSALINRLTGGRTYLWHCIVMEALDDIVRTGRIQRFMLTLTFRMIHHLVTGTDFMADYYARRYPLARSSIRVIPNYINLKRFQRSTVDAGEIRNRLGIPRHKNVVLYLHEIEEGRASLLPSIVKGVFERRDDVVFIIAGDGRYRRDLETRLKEEVEQRKVYFTGRVPNRDTPRYYACADVYIMTSNFEAFSRVLLEAMAMETPYVATDGGGNIRTYTPEDHQEFILSEDSWGRFPAKISELLDNDRRRETFIEAGREHVGCFSLERIVDVFIETVR